MSITKDKLYARLGEISKKFISVEEVWFEEETEKAHDVDVLYYRQLSNPNRGNLCSDFHTIILDLTKEQNELWECIGKNTKYKIRRSEKEQTVYEFWNTNNFDILKEFSDFYDEFALQKGLPKLNRSRLINFMNAGSLVLSWSKSRDSVPLVWHAYYYSKTCSFLLYTASLFRSSTDTYYRNMLGRANRYHHWQDILRFKELGISVYDFGGWYAGNKDQEKININKFKEEFGGEIVRNFNCAQGITMKGKLYLRLREILMQR